MPYSSKITRYNNLFWFSLVIYMISYLLPASKESGEPFLGWVAAFWGTVSMLDSPSFFIGGLANFVVAIILISRFVFFIKQKKIKKRPPAVQLNHLYVGIGAISVCMWLFIWKHPLYIGYYVWAISVISLSTFHRLHWANLSLQYTVDQFNENNKDLSDHLITEE